MYEEEEYDVGIDFPSNAWGVIGLLVLFLLFWWLLIPLLIYMWIMDMHCEFKLAKEKEEDRRRKAYDDIINSTLNTVKQKSKKSRVHKKSKKSKR